MVPGVTQDRNMRSRSRCSMCPAIHINSRSWLRSSSTHEPSDPPLRVISVTPFQERQGSAAMPGQHTGTPSGRGSHRATTHSKINGNEENKQKNLSGRLPGACESYATRVEKAAPRTRGKERLPRGRTVFEQFFKPRQTRGRSYVPPTRALPGS